MRTHARTSVGLGFALATALACACGKGEKPEGSGPPGGQAPGKDEIVARVAGKTLRRQDLDTAREQIPQFRQPEYQGAQGELRLLQALVDRDLLLKAAADRGFDRDPEVVKQMEDIRASLLLQTYRRKLVEALPKPTEEQIRRYYDQHPQEFTIPARINASWILCATRAETERARRRIVEQGKNFGEVAREVSIDKTTVTDGGLLGYFNPTGYIRSVGPDSSFARRAFAIEVGNVGEIFPYRDGWAFIKVHEKTAERVDPYERARERVVMRLTPTFSDSLLQADLAKLRAKYKVQILFDVEAQLAGKSADDLMRLATETQNATDKIAYYRVLLKRHPTYERADEAQFMIGFVYSEELQDFAKAKPEYEKVLSNFPGSGIAESARYMLQNMGRGQLPGFQDAPVTGATAPGAAPGK